MTFGFLLHWGQKFAIQPLLGIQWHVIPHWKGITLGVKMAFKNVRYHALSGRRAQKTSFLKALFRAEFDPWPALARKIEKCQI